MSTKWELVLRVRPDERSIRVEEMNDGVTSFNNDSFNPQDNKLHMPYRELLNHLKNKDPAYYYRQFSNHRHDHIRIQVL